MLGPLPFDFAGTAYMKIKSNMCLLHIYKQTATYNIKLQLFGQGVVFIGYYYLSQQFTGIWIWCVQIIFQEENMIRMETFILGGTMKLQTNSINYLIALKNNTLPMSFLGSI